MFCPGYPALSRPVDTDIPLYRQPEDTVSVATFFGYMYFDGKIFLKSRRGF